MRKEVCGRMQAFALAVSNEATGEARTTHMTDRHKLKQLQKK